MLLSSLLVSAGLTFLSFTRAADLQNTILQSSHTSSIIRDVLVGAEIIGDVLDDFEPTYDIDLAYPKAHESVRLGNDIPVKAVSKRPTFTIHPLVPTPTKKNSTFTLVLTDPDATSRADPAKSEMCHWILTNLTLPLPSDTRLTALDFELPLDMFKSNEGELESYYPPAPPPKTGKHRYVFVLLEGDSESIKPPKERPHWGYGKVRHGVKDWAKDNDLNVVGANFFYASHKKQ